MEDDRDLYRRWLRDRDEEAFAALARRHAGLVADVAWRVGRDAALAEDALQEALLRLAGDGSDRPAQVGVRAWLARAALSIARNQRRSQSARRRRERTVAGERLEATMPQGDKDLGARLDAALSQATGEDAALLALRYRYGLAPAELAQVLDVSAGAARVRVHRALERVRSHVAGTESDEARVTRALAALPAFRPADTVVETAIARAIGAKASAAKAGRSIAWPAVAIGLLLLAAAGAWVLRGSAPAGVTREVAHARDASGAAQPIPGLRGRAPPPGPAVQGGADQDTQRRSDGGAPAKVGAASPSTRGTEAREKQGRPVKLRLELIRPGAPPDRILIDNVYYRGNVFDGQFLNEMPNLVRVEAGRSIALSTRDERAAVEFVRATIPDPVPETLTLQVPDKDTQHGSRLTLAIVDAEDGRPIPGAVIEWGDRARSPARQQADAQGRMEVRLAESETLTGPAVLMFELAESWIQAPGYRGVGTPRGTREWIPSLDTEAYTRWARSGVHRIRLQRVPEELEEAQLRLRIVQHDGRPAVGLYVFLVHPIETRRGMYTDAWHDGFRRTDVQGALQTSGEGVIGLDVWRGPQWIGSYVVSLDTPEHEIRLPRLEPVALEIDDVPIGGGWWSLDDLGPKRMPADGPPYPAKTDAAASAWMEERGLVVPVGLKTTRGTIEGSRATVRLALPVGEERTVWLHVGDDRRVWKASASSGRVSLRWSELPVPAR